jgi:hypothetical protein
MNVRLPVVVALVTVVTTEAMFPAVSFDVVINEISAVLAVSGLTT